MKDAGVTLRAIPDVSKFTNDDITKLFDTIDRYCKNNQDMISELDKILGEISARKK
jgi:phage host-nuclease inhibitor protein Gam